MLAAIVGGLILLFDSGDEPEPVTPASGSDAEAIRELQDRTLTESLEKQDAGFSLRYPEGWTRSERSGIVTLDSPDNCTAISVSSPATAAQSQQLLEDSIAGLRRNFRQIRVRRDKGAQQFGGVPTTGALVAVRNQQGRNIGIRLAVSKGTELSHLTQVVLRTPPCEETAGETSLILGAIEFSR